MTLSDYEDRLDLLRRHREAIWRAEIGAWLHNIGKLHPEFVRKQAKGVQEIQPRYDYQFVGGVLAKYDRSRIENVRHRAVELSGPGKKHPWERLPERLDVSPIEFQKAGLVELFLKAEVRLPAPFNDRDYCVGDLIDFQDSAWYRSRGDGRPTLFELLYGTGASSLLTHALERAHDIASGGEKESFEDEKHGQLAQQGLPFHQSSVFGFEQRVDPCHDDLERFRQTLLEVAAVLRKALDHGAGARREATRELRRLLLRGLAESRRPLNDVLVGHMGASVAAFLKAAIARCVLDGSTPDNLQWKLLRVMVDGPSYWQKAVRIPDLIARRELFNKALDAVQAELEDHTPIGNEVFRDERGSAFVVPHLTTDADASNAWDDLIRDRIRQVWREQESGDETAPSVEFSPPFQKSRRGGTTMYQLGALLDEPASRPSLRPESIEPWWSVQDREVCTVCGLRPVVGKRKTVAGQRKICRDCDARRVKRAIEWFSKLDETIWLEEAADINGRIALLVARFRLGPWLKDGGYIEGTLMRSVDSEGNRSPKTPSFARLARVWGATTAFWSDSLADIETAVGLSGPRLRLRGEFVPRNERQLEAHHAYMLTVGDHVFSAVLADRERNELVLVENLDRSRKLCRLPTQCEDTDALKKFLLQQGGSPQRPSKLEEPTGYGARNRDLGRYRIHEVYPDIPDGSDGKYSSVIKLLQDPSMLMVIVPASEALRCASRVVSRYEREMSRVRDRLAMDIGLVYSPVANPVHALIRAGRRMLPRRDKTELRRIVDIRETDGSRHLRFDEGGPWEIPVDDWYPYLTMEDGSVRHVSQLNTGEVVRIEPSTFDWELLDTASRRFEVYYGADSLRQLHRLDQVADLIRVWEVFERSKLSESQMKALDGLLTAKQEEWGEPRWSDAKQWFVQHAVGNLTWPKSHRPRQEDLDLLVRAGQTSLLQDAIEIHLGVEKRRQEKEEAELV